MGLQVRWEGGDEGNIEEKPLVEVGEGGGGKGRRKKLEERTRRGETEWAKKK